MAARLLDGCRAYLDFGWARPARYLLWVAMQGLATLDKPARSDYLRLGPIDRPAALVYRLARITRPETPPAR